MYRWVDNIWYPFYYFVEPTKHILHKHTEIHEGTSYTKPERYLLIRCCKCNKIYFLGKVTEMYGRDGGWWHECIECALDSMTNAYMKLLPK